MIDAKLWRPGVAPTTLSLDEAATQPDGALVLTVDGALDAAEEVHRELTRVCGDELTIEMVRDLLDPDELPEVRQFGDGGRLRKVSSFGVRSLDQDQERNQGLVFQPVEFLAGDRWLICHVQRCNTYQLGPLGPGEAEPHLCDDIEEGVIERWIDRGGKTTGDIGVFYLYQLALQYTKARKALWKWLDDWEQTFYADPTESDPIKLVEPLTELHRLHGELYRRLAGLNVPRDCADSGWFANVTRGGMAQRVDEMIDHSLANLRNLSDSLRQAVSLTQSYATLRHFTLVEEQKARSEDLQHGFQLVASILLVPTLIAGIYGANTLLPGGGQWSGFIAMVVMMVLGGGAAYAVLEKGRRGNGPPHVGRFPRRSARPGT